MHVEDVALSDELSWHNLEWLLLLPGVAALEGEGQRKGEIWLLDFCWAK
jgi:hypothetical protein